MIPEKRVQGPSGPPAKHDKVIIRVLKVDD